MKKTNQNRLTGFLMLIIFDCFFLPVNVAAQSLNVNIKVNSTVGMQQLSPFEIIPANELQPDARGSSAWSHAVNTVGAFTITGKENMDVLIRLDAPEVLVNKEKHTMPFAMRLAWQNNSSSDVHKLNWSNNKNNVVKLSKVFNVVHENKMQDDDLKAYLYLKSTADVPVNSESPFEGNVHLTIEY